MKKFHLRIFDNHHHWNEVSSYDHDSYETYEDAVMGLKKVVEEFFIGECYSGVTAEDLMASIAMYGEEPVVLPDKPKIS